MDSEYVHYNRLKNLVSCTDGMSPAKVCKGELDGQTVYLKTIDKKFGCTTYSLKREAEVMNWASGFINVPDVIEYGQTDKDEFLIMSEIKGQHIDEFINSPSEYIDYLAKAIKKLQSVSISQCPFVSDIDMRLKELDYLLKNNLADTDALNKEESAEFSDPQELYNWLTYNKPAENLVLSHGDIVANLFVKNGDIYFYDLARMGLADKWLDIAMAVRDIREYCPEYEKMFYEKLDIEPDSDKINYFIWLDELF